MDSDSYKHAHDENQIWMVISTIMCTILKTIDSHSYKDVHDKKPIRIWIVIHTEMCMTKIYYNMDSHLYRCA